MNKYTNPIFCTTEQFFEVMKRPGFVRLSRYEGACGRGIFHCLTAPEDVPGFLEKKALETMGLLGASRYEIACFKAACNGLPKPPKPSRWQALIDWLS